MIALAAGCAVSALVGCSVLPNSGLADPTESAPHTTAPAVPEETPELHPDGTAKENLPFFTATLQAYAESDGAIEGVPLVDALTEAGFAKKRMQVSFDRSKTDLVADNIFVSVRFGDECLIGQVLTGDRSVYTELAAGVGPKQKLCLIGNTRPIDW